MGRNGIVGRRVNVAGTNVAVLISSGMQRHLSDEVVPLMRFKQYGNLRDMIVRELTNALRHTPLQPGKSEPNPQLHSLSCGSYSERTPEGCDVSNSVTIPLNTADFNGNLTFYANFSIPQ